MKKKILFLTEASNKIGNGHLSRCLTLSEFLKPRYKIFFISKYNLKEILPKSLKMINFNSVRNYYFDAVVIDLKLIDKDYQKKINELKIKKKIIISDKLYKKLKPSLTIIPYLNNINTNKKQKVTSGLDSLVLNKKLISIAKKKRLKKNKSHQINITLCFGGSDPKNYTYKIVKDLVRLNLNLNFNIIIGSLYNKENERKLRNIIYNFSNYKIYKNPKNLYSIFKQSKFAIINSGNIKYEFVSLGIPFLLFANDFKSKFFCRIFKNYFKFFHYKNFNYPDIKYLNTLLCSLIKIEKKLNFYAKSNKKKINFKSTENVVKHINNTII